MSGKATLHNYVMLLNEFDIGQKFRFNGKTWLCTDKGTRVIIAICCDKDDKSWYDGPPYAATEVIIDEYQQKECRNIVSKFSVAYR